MTRDADYLAPYVDAARQFGDGFGALLWASPNTQRVRFEAIRLAYPPAGKSILDVGCGRADYLLHLMEANCLPADYVGIEAVETLYRKAVEQAEKSASRISARILRADFVKEPARLFAGAEVVIFSGSLNTLDREIFYQTLSRAYDAAGEAMIFNFLSSPMLAGQSFLKWHVPEDVLSFAHTLSKNVRAKSDYLPGDCTICVVKSE